MLAVSAGECKLSSGPEAGEPPAHAYPGRVGPGRKTVSHEGGVALEVLDRDDRVLPPGDLEYRGVD